MSEQRANIDLDYLLSDCQDIAEVKRALHILRCDNHKLRDARIERDAALAELAETKSEWGDTIDAQGDLIQIYMKQIADVRLEMAGDRASYAEKLSVLAAENVVLRQELRRASERRVELTKQRELGQTLARDLQAEMIANEKLRAQAQDLEEELLSDQGTMASLQRSWGEELAEARAQYEWLREHMELCKCPPPYPIQCGDQSCADCKTAYLDTEPWKEQRCA